MSGCRGNLNFLFWTSAGCAPATEIERALQRTTTQSADTPETAEARLCGRHDGAAFALDLEKRELRERQERLTRLAWGAEGDQELATAAPRDSSAVVLRLQRDIERLSAFQSAVLSSRAWIMIQKLRRLLGRAW